MSWFLLVFLAILSYILVVKLPKRLHLLNRMKPFVGPPGLPIFGNALELNVDRKEVLKVVQGYLNRYGLRVKLFIGLQPYLGIANAEDAEVIFTSQVQIEKSSDYDPLHEWLGTGLLTSTGDKWFHRRKQLTPAFHFKILEDFLRVFNEQCGVFRGVLEGKGDQAVNIFPLITHCALDIICETAMGRRIFAQQKSDSEYAKAIYRMSELVQYRQMRPWLEAKFMWRLSSAGKEEERCLKILHDFTDLVIKEKKMERKEQGQNKGADDKKNVMEDDVYMNSARKRQAFLDLLLEAQESDITLTDENIREETDTFMFEGHDTTSAAASWTTFLLACHPEYQKKVHQELDDIFGDDRTREVTFADLSKMKYLECCIKEGLRLFPSVPFIGRKLAKEQELGDGTVIPSECSVILLIYFLHRDPKVFSDPDKFMPDRFLPENIQGRHPFAYVPFSAGPRNCIGQKFAMMEEKVIVSTIFRNFKVTPAERLEDVGVLCELITRPEHGLHVSLQRR